MHAVCNMMVVYMQYDGSLYPFLSYDYQSANRQCLLQKGAQPIGNHFLLSLPLFPSARHATYSIVFFRLVSY